MSKCINKEYRWGQISRFGRSDHFHSRGENGNGYSEIAGF